MEALAISFQGDVLAAQRGDQDAFTRLVDATRNLVCAITLAIVHDVPSSEDVAQEVFVAAWTSVHKLRNPTSFLPWLRQLARNNAHAFIRARMRYGRRHAAWGEDARDVVDPAPDATRALIDGENQRALAEAIDGLPDESREIVALYYREGNSARQVGELLGLREDAVKKRLERAREAVRVTLLERASDVLRKTAPGAGFTAAVVAAIAIAAPGTAAAATAGLTKTFGTAGVLGKASTAIVGTLFGAASAIGAIIYGGRFLWRRARDERERADLQRFLAVNLLAVAVAAGVSWLGDTQNATSATLNIITWALYAATIAVSYLVWLPRIIARRLALERLEDPGAAHRQERQRIRGIVGTIVGILAGVAGLLYGLGHR